MVLPGLTPTLDGSAVTVPPGRSSHPAGVPPEMLFTATGSRHDPKAPAPVWFEGGTGVADGDACELMSAPGVRVGLTAVPAGAL